MVKLLERKRRIYTVNGDGIFISGTSEDIASIIGYSANHLRHLAKTGKHFCLAKRDCSVSFVDIKEKEYFVHIITKEEIKETGESSAELKEEGNEGSN